MIKIPTDNLYKAISICGIVLVCFSVNNAITTLDIYKIKELDSNKRIMYWKQQDYLAAKEETNAIEKAKKREANKAKESYKKDKVVALNMDSEDIRDSITGRLDSDLIEIWYMENKYILSLVVNIGSFIGGIILLIFGIYNWYYKTQKPMDSYSKKLTKSDVAEIYNFNDIK